MFEAIRQINKLNRELRRSLNIKTIDVIDESQAHVIKVNRYIKAVGPSGTVIQMTEDHFKGCVAVGLTLRRI